MSEDIILNSLPESKTDWERIRKMTDEEIEAICEGDEDIIFMNPQTDISRFHHQSEMLLHPLLVEQKIEDWLTEHNLKAEVVAAALLKQFVEAQSAPSRG